MYTKKNYLHLCSVNKHTLEEKSGFTVEPLIFTAALVKGCRNFICCRIFEQLTCSSRLNYLFKHNPFLLVVYA